MGFRWLLAARCLCGIAGSHSDSVASQLALIQAEAESSVQRVEALAETYRQFSEDRDTIEKHAARPAQYIRSIYAADRHVLEGKLQQLFLELSSLRPADHHGSRTTAISRDSSAVSLDKIAGAVRADIGHTEDQLLNLDYSEIRALSKETRDAEIAAQHAVRGTQSAARGAARIARMKTDVLARMGYSSPRQREFSSLADKLDRQAEAAAAKAENYGELLFRRTDEALQLNMNEAEERLRKRARERQKAYKNGLAKVGTPISGGPISDGGGSLSGGGGGIRKRLLQI